MSLRSKPLKELRPATIVRLLPHAARRHSGLASASGLLSAGEPGDPGTGRSTTELRPLLARAMPGGIRTRDLPLDRRSNPNLHHRQKSLILSLRSKPLYESCSATFVLLLMQTARRASRPRRFCSCRCAPNRLSISTKRRPSGSCCTQLGATRASPPILLMKQPTLETNPTQGTIEWSVMVRRSSLKLRHSRCRRESIYPAR